MDFQEPVQDIEYVKFKAIEPPKKTFFYERQNGEIIACNNDEAANLMRSSHKHLIKQVGVSDGTAYSNFLRNSGVKMNQIIPIAQAKELLDGAFKAELEAARGHFERPYYNPVTFDASFPVEQRASFSPPA